MKLNIRYKKVIIREYPIETKMSLRALAKKANIHYTFLSKVNTGKAFMSEKTAEKVLKAIR